MSTILVISPEPWEGQFVSKHHYARELAWRGHDVLYHGPPDLGGVMRLEAADGYCGHLSILRAPRVAPGLRQMPGAMRRVLEARWLRRVERLAGKPIDVIWNFENSRFFDMRFAGDRLKIYHQVDLNQDFEPDKAAATADLSIAISGPIEQRLSPTARRMVRITHGCPTPPPDAPEPTGLAQGFVGAAVHAVLTGNLDIAYLDVPLLNHLITANPEVRFHFVGQYSVGQGLHASVSSAPNTVFWGRQPSDALPGFLRRADVLLVTYLAGEYLDQLANPHKIMEYLAAGRCVLATRTLEYEEHRGLVEVAPDRAAFAARFAAITAAPPTWNTPDLIARRQAFAADNTYPRQLDRIEKALGPRGALIS